MKRYHTMEKQSDHKLNTIICPKCRRQTSFSMLVDAIDELGEFYRCQHCGWVFHYRSYYLTCQNNTE